MEEKKLSIGTKLGYGICAFGGNIFFTATAFVLLNYLTDTVGLATGLAGTAIMIGRIWDAFYDPVIGYISDRTRTRWGRRRPYLFFGAFPLCALIILVFTNPSLFAGRGFDPAQHQTFLLIYAAVVFTGACTAFSTVNIPYMAMCPELTADFHERTSLNGYFSGFQVLGTILGAGAALPIVGLFTDRNTGFLAMGIVFGFVMLVTALITVFTVREPEAPRPAASMGIIKTYLEVFKNGPYVKILLAYVLQLVGITVISGIAIYYFKYIHRNEGMTTAALLILLLTAMVFIPISVLLGKRLGKKIVYGGGMLIMAVVLMIVFAWGHLRPANFSLVMMFFLGIGLGFTYALPYAIVPDAIEYDYLRIGERREGAFYGVWTWAVKIGQALAIFIMGWVLGIMGYVANVVPQTPRVELGIRLFLGPIAASIFVLGAVILAFYPINEKRYKEILAQIKEMEAKRQS